MTKKEREALYKEAHKLLDRALLLLVRAEKKHRKASKPHVFQEFSECCLYCGKNAYSSKLPPYCKARS